MEFAKAVIRLSTMSSTLAVHGRIARDRKPRQHSS
jgi:hypothetical protein